jgi:hypothetical protein
VQEPAVTKSEYAIEGWLYCGDAPRRGHMMLSNICRLQLKRSQQ